MNKVGLVSLGCSKNLVDSEMMLGILREQGYILEDDPAQADVLIVNTCGFIDSAKQESIDTILEMAGYKETGRCRTLVVAGCLSQRYQQEILEEIPEIDLVLGTADYHRIADILGQRVRRSFGDINCSPDYTVLPRVNSMPPYTAYLKIADGCDNCCTYCVIPSIRGRYRSRGLEELVAEAASLADSGVRELIVIAQDTTGYGTDLYGAPRLAKLLKRLCEIPKLRWVRLHYGYPEGMTEELLEVMAAQEKICHYFDIPIQHCSDAVLKRMGRRCTRAELVRLFAAIRQKMPDAVLRTSLIAGFPGETDEQFDELCEFVRQVEFDRVGVFAYSREEGTPAARMDGQLDESVKEARRDRLMELQKDISLAKNRAKLGRMFETLVEGFDTEQCLYYGRTYADSVEIDGRIYFGSGAELENGMFVPVIAEDCDAYDLYGRAKIEGGGLI